MSGPGKVPTGGGESLGHNPFAGLESAGLPQAQTPVHPVKASTRGAPPKPGSRGRVDIVRETGGRGGKTVTVVSGFVGIGLPEKEDLCKRMRSACGCGGTVKDGAIEIQGDQRSVISRILSEAGFRPVLAGG